MTPDYYLLAMNMEPDDKPEVQQWPLYNTLYHGTAIGPGAWYGTRPYEQMKLVRSTAYRPHLAFPGFHFHVSDDVKSVLETIPTIDFVLSPLVRHIAQPVDERLRAYLDSIEDEISLCDDWLIWLEHKTPEAPTTIANAWPLYEVVAEHVVMAVRQRGEDEEAAMFVPRLEWDTDGWHTPFKLPRRLSAFDRSPILSFYPWTIITQSVLDLLLAHGFLPDPVHVLVGGVDTSNEVVRRIML
jgi:hypothetical protein